MTILTNVKTKKELMAKPEHAMFKDPSVYKPICDGFGFTFADLPLNETVYVTNHPKRSWFAQVTRTENGVTVR